MSIKYGNTSAASIPVALDEAETPRADQARRHRVVQRLRRRLCLGRGGGEILSSLSAPAEFIISRVSFRYLCSEIVEGAERIQPYSDADFESI